MQPFRRSQSNGAFGDRHSAGSKGSAAAGMFHDTQEDESSGTFVAYPIATQPTTKQNYNAPYGTAHLARSSSPGMNQPNSSYPMRASSPSAANTLRTSSPQFYHQRQPSPSFPVRTESPLGTGTATVTVVDHLCNICGARYSSHLAECPTCPSVNPSRGSSRSRSPMVSLDGNSMVSASVRSYSPGLAPPVVESRASGAGMRKSTPTGAQAAGFGRVPTPKSGTDDWNDAGHMQKEQRAEERVSGTQNVSALANMPTSDRTRDFHLQQQRPPPIMTSLDPDDDDSSVDIDEHEWQDAESHAGITDAEMYNNYRNHQQHREQQMIYDQRQQREQQLMYEQQQLYQRQQQEMESQRQREQEMIHFQTQPSQQERDYYQNQQLQRFSTQLTNQTAAVEHSRPPADPFGTAEDFLHPGRTNSSIGNGPRPQAGPTVQQPYKPSGNASYVSAVEMGRMRPIPLKQHSAQRAFALLFTILSVGCAAAALMAPVFDTDGAYKPLVTIYSTTATTESWQKPVLIGILAATAANICFLSIPGFGHWKRSCIWRHPEFFGSFALLFSLFPIAALLVFQFTESVKSVEGSSLYLCFYLSVGSAIFQLIAVAISSLIGLRGDDVSEHAD